MRTLARMSADSVLPLGIRWGHWTQHVSAALLLAITSPTVTARAAGEINTARTETINPLFTDGLRALDARQYPKAKQLFERIYRTSAAPEALYQLGRVAQGEGNDVLAADLFRRYRELVGGQVDAASKSAIDGHLAGLKLPVTEVRIVAPDGDYLSVDGQLIGRSPLIGTVLIAPGKHRFAIDSNGPRFESDVLNIPEGRPAQVNLSPGNRGAAVAVLSLPPAALLVFAGSASLDASTTESIRRSIGSAMAKEQTILISTDKARTLWANESADCVARPDCIDRVAERADARGIVIIRARKTEQRSNSVQSLIGAQVVVRDVATKQIATEALFSCDGCSGTQLVERFGLTLGQLIATANSRPRTMLTVSSTPSGASVFVDGQRIGETPLDRLSFAGIHTVTAAKDGYESVEQTMDLQLHQANSIELKLPKQSKPTVVSSRPTWRLAIGGILIGGGLLTAALGVSALSVNGACDETTPTVDGVPCPLMYFTNGVGGGLLGGGLALTAAGAVLMALPRRKVDQREASYPLQTVMPTLTVDF